MEAAARARELHAPQLLLLDPPTADVDPQARRDFGDRIRNLASDCMPAWAQWVGKVFPLTHFLRIVRGILLKGNRAADISPELWPLAAFLVAVAAIAMLRYKRTLD